MIETQGLTRRFGKVTAVQQLSLSVPDSTVLALLGQNGAGKTTTVRMLAALLAPSEGEAFVAGYNVRERPDAVRACMGLVTDVPGLFEQMTVPAYLDFFGALYGIPSGERHKRIGELLEFFDLQDQSKEKMVGFSKGMKQKVALARALIHNPFVLFLDEPTSGLDPLAARSVRELIQGLKQAHRTIVLCTHDLDEAERLADQVVIMRRGRVVASGTPRALRAQFSDATSVHIELARPSPLPLDALSELEGVGDLQALSNNDATIEGQRQILTYRTQRPEVVNPQVVSRLSAAGALIISVVCETSTLEEVYTSAMHDERENKHEEQKVN